MILSIQVVLHVIDLIYVEIIIIKKLSHPSNSDNKENIMKYNFTKGILDTLLESEIELTNAQKLAILEMYPSIQIIAMKGEISFKNEKEENNKC